MSKGRFSFGYTVLYFTGALLFAGVLITMQGFTNKTGQ